MNSKNTPLATNEYYHVFNRGVAKQPIFLNKRDYEQFVLGLIYYQYESVPMRLSRVKLLSVINRSNLLSNLNGKKLIEIIAYVLMPNHFHLLIKQNSEKGISTFMSKLSNSYSKYFNTKHERVGPVLQGTFKHVYIEDEEQLLHISRYIHLNPLVSHIVSEKDFQDYPWSSLSDYCNESSKLVNLVPVLSHFSSSENYKKFVYDQIEYARLLESIKHLTLD